MAIIESRTPEPVVDRKTTKANRLLLIDLAVATGIARADRAAFVDAVMPALDRAARNLSPSRPQWFDDDVRQDFMDWMEEVADDEDEVDLGLIARDDDLLRDVLRRARETGADAFLNHLNSGDVVGVALSNPEVIAFLAAIEAADRVAYPRMKEGIVTSFFEGFESYLSPVDEATESHDDSLSTSAPRG